MVPYPRRRPIASLPARGGERERRRSAKNHLRLPCRQGEGRSTSRSEGERGGARRGRPPPPPAPLPPMPFFCPPPPPPQDGRPRGPPLQGRVTRHHSTTI